MKKTRKKRTVIVDATDALDYYLNNLNQGRPFNNFKQNVADCIAAFLNKSRLP